MLVPIKVATPTPNLQITYTHTLSHTTSSSSSAWFLLCPSTEFTHFINSTWRRVGAEQWQLLRPSMWAWCAAKETLKSMGTQSPRLAANLHTVRFEMVDTRQKAKTRNNCIIWGYKIRLWHTMYSAHKTDTKNKCVLHLLLQAGEGLPAAHSTHTQSHHCHCLLRSFKDPLGLRRTPHFKEYRPICVKILEQIPGHYVVIYSMKAYVPSTVIC